MGPLWDTGELIDIRNKTISVLDFCSSHDKFTKTITYLFLFSFFFAAWSDRFRNETK